MRTVTLKDIAGKANTSEATVSLVLNNKGQKRVSPEKRRHIEKIAADLGYSPNRMARLLSVGKTEAISVLVADITNAFYGHYVMELERLFGAEGYTVFPLITRGESKKESTLAAWVSQKFFDGTICLEYDWNNKDCYIDMSHSLPIIARAWDDIGAECKFSQIRIDYSVGIRKLLLHLSKAGRSQIGVLATSAMLVDGSPDMHNPRVKYYNMLFRELDFDCLPGYWRFADCQDVMADTYRQVRELLAQYPKIDSLIVHDSHLMPVVYNAIADAKRKVPQDLAVASFDDMPICSSLSPTVTVVCEPIKTVASHMVRLLLARIKNKKLPPEIVTVETDLIVRNSTGGG